MITRLTEAITTPDGFGWRLAITLMNAVGGILLTMGAMNWTAIQSIRTNVGELRENFYIGAAQVNARIDMLPPDKYKDSVDKQFEALQEEIMSQRERLLTIEYIVGSTIEGRKAR